MGTKEKIFEKDNDIQIVGNCANCGVEYHIHQDKTSQHRTIERLREGLKEVSETLKLVIKGSGYFEVKCRPIIEKNEQLLNTTEPIETSKAKGN